MSSIKPILHCDVDEKEKRLLAVLNGMWKCLPHEVEYKTFNKVFPAKDVNELRNLENKYPEVGIAKYGTDQEGFSTLSLMATITDVLIGKRLATVIKTSEDKQIIESFKLLIFAKDKQEE